MIGNALLSYDLDVARVMNAVAAGTTVQNGTAVDMDGWDGVLFIAALGALTATQVTSLKGQQGAASDGSDGADIAGAATAAAADADSNKLLILDIARNSGGRYVRPVVLRATANAVIDGVVAIRYRKRTGPASNGSMGATVSKLKQFLSS